MKKILLPIFVLAFVLTGAPFIVGLMIKSEAEKTMAQINENTAYTAKWASYSTGWLSSRGQLNAGVELPGVEDLTLSFDVEISHGPFLKNQGLGWAAWSVTLEKAEALRQFVEWDADTPLYDISGTVKLGGDITYKDAIAVLKAPAFAFGGYLGHGETSQGIFTYKGKSGSTEINSPMAKASIGPMQMNMTSDDDFDAMFSNKLYNTAGNFLISSVSVHGMQSFELENFEIKYDLQLADDGSSANFRFGYLIDAVEVEAYKVSDVAIEMGMENYSAKFHDQYVEFAQNLAYSGNTEASSQAIQELMDNALPSLLEAAPVFKLENIAFNLPSGNFSSKAQIKLDSISSIPANPADISFWLDKVFAEAYIAADQALVNEIGVIALSQKIALAEATPAFELDEETGEFIENTNTQQMTEVEIAETAAMQLQQNLGMLQGMGILVLDGTTYKSNLQYDHGNAQVNGQDFALPF